MADQLTKACLNLAQTAFKGEGATPISHQHYQSEKLLRTANYLLARSGVHLNAPQKIKYADNKAPVVVLFSGGVYSYVAVLRELLLGRPVLALHFYETFPATNLYGLNSAWRKQSGDPLSDMLLAVRKAGGLEDDDFCVREIQTPQDAARSLLPLVHLAYAADIASDIGAVKIQTGHHVFNYDLRLMREFTAILAEAHGKRYLLQGPFADQFPESVLHSYVALGLSPSVLIQETWSCEDVSLSQHCGTCFGCYRRWRVFQEMGWVEKSFRTLPWESAQHEVHAARWMKLLAKLSK